MPLIIDDGMIYMWFTYWKMGLRRYCHCCGVLAGHRLSRHPCLSTRQYVRPARPLEHAKT